MRLIGLRSGLKIKPFWRAFRAQVYKLRKGRAAQGHVCSCSRIQGQCRGLWSNFSRCAQLSSQGIQSQNPTQGTGAPLTERKTKSCLVICSSELGFWASFASGTEEPALPIAQPAWRNGTIPATRVMFLIIIIRFALLLLIMVTSFSKLLLQFSSCSMGFSIKFLSENSLLAKELSRMSSV